MSQMHAFYSVAYVVDGRWFVDLLCLSFIVVWFFIWRCFCARNRHVHFMSFCFCILFCSFSPHSHSLCLPVSFFVYVYKYARVRTESNMRILFLPAIYGPYIYTDVVHVYTLLIECIPRFFDSWSFYVFHFFERQQKSFLLKSICFDWFGVLWHFSSFFLFSLEIDFSIHCNHIIALFFIHCHAIQSIRKPLSPKYNFKIKLKAVPSNISRFHSVLLFGLL